MKNNLKKILACTLAGTLVIPMYSVSMGASNEELLKVESSQATRLQAGVTRGEFAQILADVMGYDVEEDVTFTDLGDEEYASAIRKLSAAHIMIGADNKVRPMDLVTWEEAVVMLGRAFELKKLTSNQLSVEKGIATWASDYVDSMVKQGYIDSTTFSPKVAITQNELMTLLEKLVQKPKPVSKDVAKIKASMLKMPTLQEVPYDDAVGYHPDVYEDKSHAFSSMYCSVGSVNLSEYGYTEKEYFMSGTANVYDLDESLGKENNVPVVALADNDYTTRLIVRYPSDTSKFTGRVYIDILNASSGVDLEDLWRRSYDHIMQEGHAYIGITSKSLTADALKKFDAERYAQIDWLDKNGTQENGLAWDMLGQLGTYIKSEEGMRLFGKPVEATYLCGQSQSGFYVNTFLNVFYPYINNINNGQDLFDGYLNLVGWANTKLAGGNIADETRDVSVTGGFAKTEEPYIVIMSEWEASLNAYRYVEDKDKADWKFRLYEVAGAPHSDPTSPIIPNNEEIGRAHATGKIRAPKVYDTSHYESDLNIDPFVDAALENLHDWSVEGIEAPSACDRWISIDENGEILRDAYNNALGGVRAPLITAPIATYYASRNGSKNETDGSMIYFTDEQLKAIYPQGKERYVSQFKIQAEQLLKDKLITERGLKAYIAYANEMDGLE